MIEKAYRRIMEENRVDAALLQNTIEAMKLEEGRLFEKDGARVKKGKPSFGRGLRLGTIGVAAVFLLLCGVHSRPGKHFYTFERSRRDRFANRYL